MPKKIYIPDSSSVYDVVGSEGYLALPIRSKYGWEWTYCREIFHKRGRSSKLLYYSRNVDNVIAFIKVAEDLLKLPIEKRSKIYYTNKENVVCIFYGPWWSVSQRRELFTIFLRIGRRYDIKRCLTNKGKIVKWWKIAKKNRYLTQTKIALEKFMEGRNKFNTKLKVEVPNYDDRNNVFNMVKRPIKWIGWCRTLGGRLNEEQIEKINTISSYV